MPYPTPSTPRTTTTAADSSVAASVASTEPLHESAFRRHRTAIITTASLALLGTAALATFFFAPAALGVMGGYALSLGNALSTFSLTQFASTLVGQMTIAAVATSALTAGLVASFKNRGKIVPQPSDEDLSEVDQLERHEDNEDLDDTVDRKPQVNGETADVTVGAVVVTDSNPPYVNQLSVGYQATQRGSFPQNPNPETLPHSSSSSSLNQGM